MSKKPFDFKEQIAIGDVGQRLFIQHYHTPIVQFGPHKADFKRLSDGKLVELKTDSYDMGKTENFFIERFSSFNTKSPGGPWQSKEKRVPIFCYFFIKNGVYFEFDTKELVKFLDPIAEKAGLIFIPNKGWTTAGFKVPREKLKHLYTEHKINVKN
jgi:hypothetical protein